MTRVSTVSGIVLVLAAFSTAVPSTFAGFRQKHPRRAEVNGREQNQQRRIRQGVKNGTLTEDEAKADRQNLRDVKKEERSDVRSNGGSLTKDQKKDLNQQLNQNSRQIRDEKNDGTAPTAPTAGTTAQ